MTVQHILVVMLVSMWSGHGTPFVASWCEQNMADLYLQIFRAILNPADAMVHSFRRGNEILDMLNFESGATGIMIHCCSKLVTIGNIGTVRAYLFRDSSVYELTTPHNASDPEENWRVVAMGTEVYNGLVAGCANFTRSMGDSHLREMGVASVPSISQVLAQDDMIIIADYVTWMNQPPCTISGVLDAKTAKETAELFLERVAVLKFQEGRLVEFVVT